MDYHFTLGSEMRIAFKASREELLEVTLRKRLRKVLGFDRLVSLHQALALSVPVCNVCASAFVPHRYNLEVEGSCVRVVGVQITRQFQYCYGESLHCSEWAKGSGKRNPNSAEFIAAVRRCSLDEALSWIKSNNSSPFYSENFASDDEYGKSQTRGLKFFTDRFGEVGGLERYNLWIAKANHTRSLEGYIERYGLDEGTRRHLEVQREKDSMSLKNLKLRNPDKSNSDIESLLISRRRSVGITASVYISKHGTQKWEVLRNSRAASNRGRTDKRYLELHGEEALNLLKERRRLLSHGGKISKWARCILDEVFKSLHSERDLTLRYGKSEYRLFDAELKRWYYYDLFAQRGDRKFVVELNGRCYHAPPNLSKDEEGKWRALGSRKTWEESRSFDNRKQSLLSQEGIELLVVWDYEKKSDICTKILEFLDGRVIPGTGGHP